MQTHHSLIDPGLQSSFDGDVVSLQVAVVDNLGGANTVDVVGAPTGLGYNPSTCRIEGTITSDADQDGPFVVLVTTNDGASETINWVVASPTITFNNPGTQNNFDGENVSLQLTATEDAGHSLTFALDSETPLPDGLSLTSGGLISGLIGPDADLNSDYTITVIVTDSLANVSTSQTFTWNVSVHEAIWTGDGDNVSWSDPDNWADQVVPGIYDHAVIDDPNTSTVIIGSNDVVTIKGITCSADLEVQGALTLTAGNSSVTGSLDLTAALSLVGNTTLLLDGGGSFLGALDIGEQAAVILQNGPFVASDAAALPQQPQGVFVVGNGGVAQLDIATNDTFSRRNLELRAGGTIAGAGTMATNHLVWTGGTMTGTGRTEVARGDDDESSEWSGNGDRILDRRTLVTTTTNYRAGTLTVRNGATIESTGTLYLLGDVSISAGVGGGLLINRIGVSKDDSSGTSVIEIEVLNLGLIGNSSGTLRFTGKYTQKGPFTATENGQQMYSGGIIEIACDSWFSDTYIEVGTLGRVNFVRGPQGQATTSNWDLVRFAQTPTSIADGVTMVLRRATFTGCNVTNDGTIAVEPGNSELAPFRLTLDGSVLQNNPTGVFSIDVPDSVEAVITGAGATIINLGRFAKSGVGRLEVRSVFNNFALDIPNNGLGTFVSGGELWLTSGGQSSSYFDMSQGAVLVVSGTQTYSLTPTASFGGDGILGVRGAGGPMSTLSILQGAQIHVQRLNVGGDAGQPGTIEGPGAIIVDHFLAVDNATFRAGLSLQIANNANMEMEIPQGLPSATARFENMIFDNYGTVDWNAGVIELVDATGFSNHNQFNINTDGVMGETTGNSQPVFYNTGTLRKTQGNGFATITPFVSNSGTIQTAGANFELLRGLEQLDTGRLQINGGTIAIERYFDGRGTFSLSDGGLLLFRMATFPAAPITFSDSTVNIASGDIRLDSSEQIIFQGTSTVTMTAGLQSSIEARVLIESGSVLTGIGTIVGPLDNRGVINVGGANQAGQLTVLGSYNQHSVGTLNIELGPQQSDSLDIIGQAKLRGTLNISLIDGCAPNPATPDIYTILTYSSLDATLSDFETINGTDLGNDAILFPVNGATQYTLTALQLG